MVTNSRQPPEELMWDEDPRPGNALWRMLAKLLAAGLPLSICVSLYAGNLDSLWFYCGALALLLVVFLLWWSAAAVIYASLRTVFFLLDVVRIRRTNRVK